MRSRWAMNSSRWRKGYWYPKLSKYRNATDFASGSEASRITRGADATGRAMEGRRCSNWSRNNSPTLGSSVPTAVELGAGLLDSAVAVVVGVECVELPRVISKAGTWYHQSGSPSPSSAVPVGRSPTEMPVLRRKRSSSHFTRFCRFSN